MKTYRARLLLSGFVTHDVRRYVLTRPEGFEFKPGQGTEIAIDTPDWHKAHRPFTPTSLPGDGALEFTVKSYRDRGGVTSVLPGLDPGTEFTLTPAFGTITYQGPGTFIAGGAGITPMLAIVRDLARRGELGGHRMLFSNKTPADVVCERELRHCFGDDLVLTCTRGAAPGYESSRINREFLAEHVRDFGARFYVCGPPGFAKDVTAALRELGADADALIFED